MPELPDVAVFQRYVDSTSLHQTIDRVEVRDAGVLEGVSRRKLTSTLTGRRFESTRRHGKHLFVELDGGESWLVLHFGMTGQPQYFKDAADAPPHTRVLFAFDNGYHLAYDCPRKLGRMTLTADPDEFIRRAQLGPDALDDVSDLETFSTALGAGRRTVKSALMQQESLAGIGNIYSDEILFQARVHPQRRVQQLTPAERRRVFQATRRVLETAIDHQVDVGKFPRSWLLPNRDGDCPRCGATIAKLKVSGRTAHLCPRCQPERD